MNEYKKDAEKFYKSQLENKEQISYYELPCRVGKSKTMWVGQTSILELDEIGNPRGYSVTARDITDRKQTEDKLLQTTKELTLAHNVARLGSFTYDIPSAWTVKGINSAKFFNNSHRFCRH